jgi:hypothetical protein
VAITRRIRGSAAVAPRRQGAATAPPRATARGFPIWPLWFAAFAFTHTRRAAALLVAGIAVAAIFGLGPHWLGD